MAAVATFAPKSGAPVNGLLSGTKWDAPVLTFSFPAMGSYYSPGGLAYGQGENTTGFSALNTVQQNVARAVLGSVAAITDLAFAEIVERSDRHADIRLAESGKPATAWAYLPASAPVGGDIWFNSGGSYNAPAKGNYAFAAFLHEIGHALGLKHAHEEEGGFGALPTAINSMEYTVMSYRSYVGSTAGYYTNEAWGYAQSFMMYDIAALQQMYGADFTTNSGNTRYSWDAQTGEVCLNGKGQGAPGANKVFMTIWDGGGSDTYDFSDYSNSVSINLRAGAWCKTSSAQLARLDWGSDKYAAGNVANALLYQGNTRSLIEKAIGGSGNDTITGNSARNWLNGGAGADTMRGLGGGDTYVVKQAGDKVIEGLNAGSDLIRSSVSYALPRHVEKLTLIGSRDISGTGNDARNVIVGNSGDNSINGRGGNDVLNGGLGRDTVRGGYGADDIYAGADNVRDVFVFASARDSGASLSSCDQIFQFDRSWGSGDASSDRIDLHLLDADPAAGDQAFRFVKNFATALPGRADGQVRVVDTGANMEVRIDLNGDNTTDMLIQVMGVDALTIRDFLL